MAGAYTLRERIRSGSVYAPGACMTFRQSVRQDEFGRVSLMFCDLLFFGGAPIKAAMLYIINNGLESDSPAADFVRKQCFAIWTKNESFFPTKQTFSLEKKTFFREKKKHFDSADFLPSS